MNEYGYQIAEHNGEDCLHVTLEFAPQDTVQAYIPIDSIQNSYRMYRGINGTYNDLDHVNDCMRSLSHVLDILDPSEALRRGTAGVADQATILRIAKEKCKKLSDAILALRNEGKHDWRAV